MFTDKDFKAIESKGISTSLIEKQIECFKNGFPPLNLKSAATTKKGIMEITPEQAEFYTNLYTEKTKGKRLVKFVPASGAASRMFKDLFSWKNTLEKGSYPKDAAFCGFLNDLPRYPFFPEIKKGLTDYGLDCDNLSMDTLKKIFSLILTDEGLNYGFLPKGLIQFHNYLDVSRTAFEEHLTEGALYASADNKSAIHFTVSEQHIPYFNELLSSVKDKYSSKYNIQYDISFSVQKPSTDMIAVDENNAPFRNESGDIVFRPGGHGALLENLNDIDGDIIFVKNIDNVVPDYLKDITVTYKKVLAAILLEKQERAFKFLNEIDGGKVNSDRTRTMLKFIKKDLRIGLPDGLKKASVEEQVVFIKEKLNRPFRVCGMVKNEGEPGGGPFRVNEKDDSISLQIVESVQIDLNDPKQKEIFQDSTHFNPVDLVCGVKDYKGEAFDLTKYRNPDTGIITSKSLDGKDLKAQELPGLWNGSMDNWTSIFVEVPLITFNPVKTIFDLLRKEHQTSNDQQ